MAEPVKFVFSGRYAGGAFGIVGEGFGPSGTLTIGGRPIPTTLWTDKDIRGLLPKDLVGNQENFVEVLVASEKGFVQKGIWPPPHPKSTTPLPEHLHPTAQQMVVPAAAIPSSAVAPQPSTPTK